MKQRGVLNKCGCIYTKELPTAAYAALLESGDTVLKWSGSAGAFLGLAPCAEDVCSGACRVLIFCSVFASVGRPLGAVRELPSQGEVELRAGSELVTSQKSCKHLSVLQLSWVRVLVGGEETFHDGGRANGLSRPPGGRTCAGWLRREVCEKAGDAGDGLGGDDGHRLESCEVRMEA